MSFRMLPRLLGWGILAGLCAAIWMTESRSAHRLEGVLDDPILSESEGASGSVVMKWDLASWPRERGQIRVMLVFRATDERATPQTFEAAWRAQGNDTGDLEDAPWSRKSVELKEWGWECPAGEYEPGTSAIVAELQVPESVGEAGWTWRVRPRGANDDDILEGISLHRYFASVARVGLIIVIVGAAVHLVVGWRRARSAVKT